MFLSRSKEIGAGHCMRIHLKKILFFYMVLVDRTEFIRYNKYRRQELTPNDK